MANSYFQFKQFTVHHDRCAMKVGTDGVLLGAWADVADKRTALDVGCGSGLVSLMLAQRNRNLKIDAVEVDVSAADQAAENISASIFSTQIDVVKEDFIAFAFASNKKYDLIVSNPPFFSNSLKSPTKQRNAARHDDGLCPEDLLHLSAKLLTSEGVFVVIYPFDSLEKIIEIGKNEGLFPLRICTVYPTPNSQPKRVLVEMSLKEKHCFETNLIVEMERHVYSEEFKEMTREFYLDK